MAKNIMETKEQPEEKKTDVKTETKQPCGCGCGGVPPLNKK